MAETPTCSCGANEPGRIIFPCAGQANTGQLSNLAAVELTEEGYGSIACVALLAIGAEGLVTSAKNADEVVVIDGCPMHCAKKIAARTTRRHLGIDGSSDDVDLVSACWRGVGKSADAPGPGRMD